MFMCKTCFDETTKNRGLFLAVSTGPCEDCGKVSTCADVPSDISIRYAPPDITVKVTDIYGVDIEKRIIPF